jgi:hypothetical protein
MAVLVLLINEIYVWIQHHFSFVKWHRRSLGPCLRTRVVNTLSSLGISIFECCASLGQEQLHELSKQRRDLLGLHSKFLAACRSSKYHESHDERPAAHLSMNKSQIEPNSFAPPVSGRTSWQFDMSCLLHHVDPHLRMRRELTNLRRCEHSMSASASS